MACLSCRSGLNCTPEYQSKLDILTVESFALLSALHSCTRNLCGIHNPYYVRPSLISFFETPSFVTFSFICLHHCYLSYVVKWYTQSLLHPYPSLVIPYMICLHFFSQNGYVTDRSIVSGVCMIHPFSILLVPRVWFERESYTATEGAATENHVMVTVVSDRPVPRGVVEVDIINGTAKG